MRVLKNILIGLGGLFLVVIALLAWIGVSSSQFRKEQAPFVQTFVTDLSKRWNVADVYDRMANPFIEQVSTPQPQQLPTSVQAAGRADIGTRYRAAKLQLQQQWADRPLSCKNAGPPEVAFPSSKAKTACRSITVVRPCCSWCRTTGVP